MTERLTSVEPFDVRAATTMEVLEAGLREQYRKAVLQKVADVVFAPGMRFQLTYARKHVEFGLCIGISREQDWSRLNGDLGPVFGLKKVLWGDRETTYAGVVDDIIQQHPFDAKRRIKELVAEMQ